MVLDRYRRKRRDAVAFAGSESGMTAAQEDALVTLVRWLKATLRQPALVHDGAAGSLRAAAIAGLLRMPARQADGGPRRLTHLGWCAAAPAPADGAPRLPGRHRAARHGAEALGSPPGIAILLPPAGGLLWRHSWLPETISTGGPPLTWLPWPPPESAVLMRGGPFGRRAARGVVPQHRLGLGDE